MLTFCYLCAFPSAPAAFAGAMQMDGQFQVNAFGVATYRLPLTVPPGTADMQPSLTLDYNSAGGDGLLGVGWSLGGFVAIGRCPRTPVQDGFAGSVAYDANDRFCLDDQRLILISGTYGGDGAEYRTEVETFTRIISHGTAGSGPAWFELRTKSGQTMQLGNSTDSRILAQGQASARIWSLNRITDTKGNYETVTYTNNTTTGEYYPTQIDYTGNASAGLAPYASVKFLYQARPATDPVIGYLGGSMVQLTQRLIDIQTYVGSTPVLDYGLGYRTTWQTQRSTLTGVGMCSGNTHTNCPQATTFSWDDHSPTLGYGSFTQIAPDNSSKNAIYGDVDGDGVIDILGQDSNKVWNLRRGPSYSTAINTGINDNIAQLADLSGHGKTDLITLNSSNQLKVYPSTGSGFGTGTVLTTLPNSSKFAFADLNRDGRPDLIYWNGGQISYALWNGSAFGTAQAINLNQNHISSIGTAFAANISGHGLADLVVTFATSESSNPLKVTYVLWNGTGFNAGIQLSQTNAVPTAYASDINGDSLTDVYITYSGGGPSALYIANGKTLNASVTGAITGSQCPKGMQFADLYRTGRTDLVCQTSANAVSVAPSTGTNVSATLTSVATLPSNGTAIIFDLKGRGVPDLVYANTNFGILTSQSGLDGTADLVTTIDTQLNGQTLISYKSLINQGTFYTKGTSAAYPFIDVQPMFFAVSQVKVPTGAFNNGNEITDTMSYTYAGAQVEADGRGFLGFQQVNETDSLTGLSSTTNYRLDFPYLGLVASETKRSGATTLSQVTNTYSRLAFAGTRSFPYLSNRVAQATDLDGTAMPTVTTTYQVDSYGNNTQLAVTSSDGSTKTTTSTYTNDATLWFLGRLTQAQVTSRPAGGTALTRTSSFAYNAGNGLLTQEVIEPNTSSLRLQTDYTYDAYGNKTGVTVSGADIATRSSSTTYDTKGRFPSTVTNALGQAASTTFEPNFGGIATVTDVNGLVTQTQYDVFGRKVQVIAPDGTRTTTSYTDVGDHNNDHYYIVRETPFAADGTTQIGPKKSLYFDKFERQTAAETQGLDGSTIRQATTYDAMGRIATTTRPYFKTGGTPQIASFAYDILGRVLTETAPDGSATQHAYHGLSQTHTNALAQTRTVLQNSQGKTVRVTDALGHDTTFTYDGFENVLTTTDSLGHVISAGYDLRGRKIAMSDPDLGNWSYGYDVLGELVTQTDAKSQVTTLSYDLLGRVVGRTEADMISSWTYDTQPHGIGKLASTGNLTGFQRSFAYDALSRPVQTTLSVAGASYVVTTSYDANSRIAGVTYASGVAVTYGYSATTGYLQSVTDSASGTVLWSANTQDAEGHVTLETLGNGLANSYGYNAQTGRLEIIQSGVNNAVENAAYTYDVLGNLTQRVDYLAGLTDTLGYDALNRLTSVATVNATQSINLSKTASYDAIGNITSRSELGTYGYDPAHVHAVNSISGAMNATYAYDANGNMTTGGGRTISWTSFDMVQQVTQGANSTAYDYDTDHHRVSSTEADGSVKYYINDPTSGAMAERVLSTTSPVMWNDYIMVAGSLVALRVTGTGGATTQYFHKDHLGSIAVVSDDSGTVQEHDSYDAWGKRRYSSGLDLLPTVTLPSIVTRGFTGQEQMDGVGLINFNGRIYDPTIGRFLSADPFVQSSEDSQSYNRYSYLGNNPLSGTDPSGYFSIGGLFRHIIHAIVSAFKWLWRSTIGRMLLAIAAAALGQLYLAPFLGLEPLGAAVLGGAIGGAVGTGTLKGAIIGAVTAAAFFEVGSLTFGDPVAGGGLKPNDVSTFLGKNNLAVPANILGHAAVGCLQGVVSGGQCGPQALAGAIGAAASVINARLIPGQDGLALAGRGAVTTVAGGVASVAGGGKFVDGAETAAFGYLFNEGAHILDVLDPNPGGGEGMHACEQGFARCLAYGEQLYDKGYVAESHELYLGCRAASALCYSNENEVQTDPRALGGETYFPPNKSENGGGFVTHFKGETPFYTPPSTDPISPIKPKKKPPLY